MAKFCGKCGANIENAVAFCPNCGQKLKTEDTTVKKELQPSKAEKKTSGKTKRKKRIGLRIAATLLSLVIATGGILGVLVYFDVLNVPIISNMVSSIFPRTLQKIYATEIVNAFENNDMSAINNIIFDSTIIIEENIGVTFENRDSFGVYDKSMLKVIFSETRLSLSKVEDGNFIYEIEAPQMAGVFGNISHLKTEEELLAHIEQFAKSAKKEKTEVGVAFTESDGRYTANYKSEEFINAITGGLVNEYKNIITQYMDELISKG